MEYPIGCFAFSLGTVTEQKPVAYVSGTAPWVKATFLTDCPSTLRIKGTVIIQGPVPAFEFPERVLTPSNGKVEYKDANGGPIAANNVFQAGIVGLF